MPIPLHPNCKFNPSASSTRALVSNYSQNSTMFYCIGLLTRLPISTKDLRPSFINMIQVMSPYSLKFPSGFPSHLEYTLDALSALLWLQGSMWFGPCLIFFLFLLIHSSLATVVPFLYFEHPNFALIPRLFTLPSLIFSQYLQNSFLLHSYLCSYTTSSWVHFPVTQSNRALFFTLDPLMLFDFCHYTYHYLKLYFLFIYEIVVCLSNEILTSWELRPCLSCLLLYLQGQK